MTPDFVSGFCVAIAIWGAARLAGRPLTRLLALKAIPAKAVAPHPKPKPEWMTDEELEASFNDIITDMLPDERAIVVAWSNRYDPLLAMCNVYFLKDAYEKVQAAKQRPPPPTFLPAEIQVWEYERERVEKAYKEAQKVWFAEVIRQKEAMELAWLREIAGREGVKPQLTSGGTGK